MTLNEKLKNLPNESGVYIFKDSDGNIIYVGKAVVVKNRVRQYFHSNPSQGHTKVAAMVSQIEDLEFILTLSEKDAFALEASLIKKHSPKYNILLKDDKASPYIRINLAADYPDLSITRKPKKDGAKYFGPYFAGVRINELVSIIRSAYQVRFCKSALKQKRECLNFHINLCLAPCQKKVTKQKYRQNLDKAIAFLKGADDQIKGILEDKMKQAVSQEDFERAIGYRDQLEMIKKLKAADVSGFASLGEESNFDLDIDCFAFASDGDYCTAAINIVRGGRMMGVKNFYLGLSGLSKSDTLFSFIAQYYNENEVPKLVALNIENDGQFIKNYDDRFANNLDFKKENLDKIEGEKSDKKQTENLKQSDGFDGLKEYLKHLRGGAVSVFKPLKGYRKRLMDMAIKNATEYLTAGQEQSKRDFSLTTGACQDLAAVLNLPKIRRIECYDVSNIQGQDVVASGVCFVDGRPLKSDYRRYKIRTVATQDDYASHAEVMSRRFKSGAIDIPDLIVIDGGKGQLSAAIGAIRTSQYFGLSGNDSFASQTPLDSSTIPIPPVIALAERDELIFTLNNPHPIALPKGDYALRLLVRIRDEAHRFALNYNRHLRQSRLDSELKKIDGVGKSTMQKLNKAFSFEDLKTATAHQIHSKAKVSLAVAKNIEDYFKKS